jgi:serine/threonine-protein kinase
MSPAASVVPVPELVAGRYTLHRLLGSGASGDVWEAFDAIHGANVALKLARPEATLTGARSLSGEAQVAARVHHPNVVAVIDHADGDEPFLAMELEAGRTLRDRLRSGRLPLAELRMLAHDLLHGLSAVHAAGIAHRDVKPTNVLHGTDGRWKLADFGIAAPLAPVYGVTRLATTVQGTQGYLAPERLTGRPASVASDLWAAAVVLHEAALGFRPTSSGEADDSTPASVVRIGSDAPARSAFVRALRPALDPDPSRRPPSALRLACELERALASRQTTATISSVRLGATRRHGAKRKLSVRALRASA